MKYGILSVLLAWIFPTQKDRNQFRNFCKHLDNRTAIAKAQSLYPKIISKVKENARHSKVKVLFLVNEISKWKTQSLYDLLDKSEMFEPCIALTLADSQKRLSKSEKKVCLEANYKFFSERNMKCIYAWDMSKNKALNLKKFKPDIIFYQQPWYLPLIQEPKVTSHFALTCYIPYFVPNYGILNMDCSDFHQFLFRNYTLNEDWANYYKDYLGEENSKNIYGLGHTMLDEIFSRKGNFEKKDFVIYAPHWSIPYGNNKNDENYSTFLWSGKVLLDYAQKHKDIKWVFKPHPTLKLALKRTGLYSQEEIEDYYRAWEDISISCYDSNYVDLFNQSKCMITDCGSFLVEYFCTKNPVIHLISDKCLNVPPKTTRKIFDTFYQTNNVDELEKILDNLLQQGNDYKKDERDCVLKNFGFEECNAAQNIMADLESVIN